MFVSLYGYVLVYDSYKHHSKYPFDNYRINVLQWGVICLWHSILTRGLLYIENCKALSIWTPLQPSKTNLLLLPGSHFSVMFV